MSNSEDDSWLYGMDRMGSTRFRDRWTEGRRLRRLLATLADQESGGDHTRYAQLLVGPGKWFDHGEIGKSIQLEGLAGSHELERIRRELAMLPRLPRPLNSNVQTAGRKRRATKKIRSKMRRQTKKTNNMRRQRGGGLKEDALEMLKKHRITNLDNFLFDSGEFKLNKNGTSYNNVVLTYDGIKRYVFQKTRDISREYNLTVYEESNPGVKEILYRYFDY